MKYDPANRSDARQSNDVALERLQNLLKQLFEIDASSDLDFGIYRILNYRRAEITKFIEQKLPERVENAFSSYAVQSAEENLRHLDEVKQEILDTLGEEAFDDLPTGKLKEEFKRTKLGQKYESLLQQRADLFDVNDMKAQVYNDLYTFFSRYYEDGDFIPRYRYSIKGHKYAIPYNGEEIKLYWVNSGQYYTKTGTLFRDYAFVVGNNKVIFRVVDATEELGSNKATKDRFFVLDKDQPLVFEDIGDKHIHSKLGTALILRFNYRELYDGDVWLQQAGSAGDNAKEHAEPDENEIESADDDAGASNGATRIKQDKINPLLEERIIQLVGGHDKALADWLAEPVQRGPQQNELQTLLSYHLRRFTSKNTRDYFIHKNLRGFLSDQLDYFIKSEVLDTDTFLKPGGAEKQINRANAVKELGNAIIDFLAQVEDFQKRLWEKKKFVLKTDYVITLNKLAQWTSPEFMKYVEDAVLSCDAQLKDWNKLLGLDPGETTWNHDQLVFSENGNGTSKKNDTLWNEESANEALPIYKPLPLDTAYFDEQFKWELLEKISQSVELEESLDGVLIKSENFQALNTLLSKYKGEVQTIYIDPPFNKEQDADYLYNVKYKDSTWASMLENRLRLAKEWLNERGSIFVRCDYNGNWIVRPLMNEIFGKENFRNEIFVKRGYVPKGLTNQYSTGIDSIFFYAKDKSQIAFKGAKRKIKEEDRQWISLDMPGQRKSYELQVRYIFGEPWLPPKGQHWGLSQAKISEYEKLGWIRINTGRKYVDTEGKEVQGMPEYLKEPELLLDTNWTDIKSYETHNTFFPTENSEILLKRIIEGMRYDEQSIILDFFLGSGTTTAVAHKLGRKWIGVEMGEHFWTVDLPRMKKVVAYDKSGISKEQDVKETYNEKTAGGFFKYQILEQYEDALDNLELSPNDNYLSLFQDEYLLKYFLTEESKDSPYLLQVEQLSKPFSYKLKVNLKEVGEAQEMLVDLPETFNYLLGISIKRLAMKHYAPSTDNKEGSANSLLGNEYLFVIGTEPEAGQEIAVVWRNCDPGSWQASDYEDDRKFIVESLEEIAHNPLKLKTVYVNGQTTLTSNDLGGAAVVPVEAVFKQLMEPSVVNTL